LWALVWACGHSAAQANADLGWRIITDRTLGNCGACHAWQAVPASTSTFAPSLDGVGQRYSAAQLKQWVVDPRHLRPDTLMPVFGSLIGLRQPAPAQAVLSTEQIDAYCATRFVATRIRIRISAGDPFAKKSNARRPRAHQWPGFFVAQPASNE
jgi:sulfur-oxidizing protein SoxX